MANAALWDVRNEYLYLTAEAEGEVKDSYIAAFGKTDKELSSETKLKALASLKGEIKKMIKGVRR